MELTQLRWDKPWSKINLKGVSTATLPVPAWEKKVEWELWEIKEIKWKKILTPHKSIYTQINQEKVEQPTELQHWDTIRIGEWKSEIYAAHKPWKKLDQKKVEEHLDKTWLNIPSEELFSIINSIKYRQNLIVRTSVIVAFILTIIVTGAIFYIYNIKSENQQLKNQINEFIFPTEGKLKKLELIVWSSDIDILENTETVIERVNNLEKSEENIKKDYDKNIKSIQDKIKKLETTISNTEIKPEVKREINEMISRFIDDFDSQLDLSKKIESFWDEKIKIEQLIEKVDSIQEVLNEESNIDFWENGEEVWDAIRILLNKVIQLKEEVELLSK